MVYGMASGVDKGSIMGESGTGNQNMPKARLETFIRCANTIVCLVRNLAEYVHVGQQLLPLLVHNFSALRARSEHALFQASMETCASKTPLRPFQTLDHTMMSTVMEIAGIKLTTGVGMKRCCK